MKPLTIQGRVIHQIGLPYHWSSKGLVQGDPANDLIGFVADPNVSIQESKAFTVMIEAGRHSAKRRRSTSGPLVRDVKDRSYERDLPAARKKTGAAHDHKLEESKEGRSN
jgi:formate dehydrogenase major subunit